MTRTGTHRWRRFGGAALGLTIALGALACASATRPAIRTDAEFDRNASFEGLRSYAFLVPPNAAPRDPRVDPDLFRARVQRAVSAVLDARGFVRDVRGTPDFLVAHHAALAERMDVDQYIDLDVYGYRTWAQPMRTRQVISSYDQGTLILDVIDARTKTLVWRGYGETRVDLDGDSTERAQLIREVVAQMLERFPPR